MARLLPLSMAATSLIFLVVMALITSPTTSVAYILLFLGVLLVFLASLGYAVISDQAADVPSKRARRRVILLASVGVSSIMLRSVGSLGLAEAGLLLVLTLILFFYLGRYPG